MLKVLNLCLCLLVAVVLGSQGDLKRLESLSRTLKYDATSLNQYQQIIAQLSRLQSVDDDEEVQKNVLLDRLYYRAGIIQLSLNQELNAIDSFEHVRATAEAFNNLAKSRLKKLYVEFGIWDKVDGEDGTRQSFTKLNNSVLINWTTNHDYLLIEEDLQRLLEISPSCLETRSLLLETLFYRLADSLDVSIGHDIIKNYERLLETHGAKFPLKKRLHIYHSMAVIQAFILNSEPTHLRKCLALDMDYEPCRRLTLLHNKLKKINPPRSEVLDPEVYASGDNAQFDWHKVVRFYLRDKIRCVSVPKDYQFENNYKLVIMESRKSIENLLPPGTTIEKSITPEFEKFVNMVLCQSAMESPSTRISTQPFCKIAMEEIVPKETIRQFYKSMTSDQVDLGGILEEIWQSYPHLAIHMIRLIINSGKNVPAGVQDKLYQFYQKHGLDRSSKKVIENQYRTLSDLVKDRRQQQRRQQQQRQQQQWFHHQQQEQQHYRQGNSAPPNGPRTDRDYYKILGIPKTANAKDIRRAYLEFTKKYHPDKQGQLSEEDENKIHEKMSMINEAYETLSDTQKRREYDQAREGSRGGTMNPNLFKENGARSGSSRFGNAMKFKPNFKFNFR